VAAVPSAASVSELFSTRSSAATAATCTAGCGSLTSRIRRAASAGIAATLRNRAHSSRFHQRAELLLARTNFATNVAPARARAAASARRAHARTISPAHRWRAARAAATGRRARREWRRAGRPAAHRRVHRLATRIEPRTAPQSEPAVEDNEDDECRQQQPCTIATMMRKCRALIGRPNAGSSRAPRAGSSA